MDIAELGIGVDSDPVKEANDQLDEFSGKAGKAQDAAIAFRRGAEEASTATDKMAGDLKSASEGFNWIVAGAAAAAAAIGTTLALGISSSIKRLEEEERLLRQFDQALSNVGNTANTSSAEFKKFADDLEDATGRAAEEVMAIGSNLATFGFSNDVFYDSIKLANDMSAAWGGDLRSSMEGLGRALDDPIAGFAMLQKRGISLTDDQAALVQQLVDTNQKLEAQRYIIEVLNEQVGGVAEAGFTGFAAAQQRLSKSVEDFFDAIVEGTGLIDLLTVGMNAAASAINFVAENMDVLLAILAPIGVAIGVAFGPTAVSMILGLATTLSGPLLTGIQAVTAALMANPFVALAAGITAAIAVIWKFREELGLTDERLKAIGEVGSRVFNIITQAVSVMYGAVAPWIEAIYDRLMLWGGYIVDTLTPAFTFMYETLVPIFEQIAQWIDDLLSGLENLLGITRQAASATSSSKSGGGDGKGAAAAMEKAVDSGGKKAAASMEKAVDNGGKKASTSIQKAGEETGMGFATALDLANSRGAAKMERAHEQGGQKASSAMEAMSNIMSAKFEGTGRNIYDLWNNWGDSFIDSFQTSIGQLLAEFQKAQTNLIEQQAKLANAQASYYRAMAADIRDGGSGRSSGGSSGRGGYGSSSGSLTGKAGSVGSSYYGGGGSGGSELGLAPESSGGMSVTRTAPKDPWVSDSMARYKAGTMGSEKGSIVDTSSTSIKPTYQDQPGDKPQQKVEVTVVNQMDANDLLNSMASKTGQQIIYNVVRTSIADILGG